MKKRDRVLAELREGPCTAAELGAILGWPMRKASAWLGNLRCAGVVDVMGTRPVGNRHSFIYQLKEGKA